MDDEKRCGHCGNSVPKGYTVCRGCGANYRGNPKTLSRGIILLIFVIWISSHIISRSHGSDIITGILSSLVLIAVPVLLIRNGLRKKWYRFNA
jgi:hypothetical protein